MEKGRASRISDIYGRTRHQVQGFHSTPRRKFLGFEPPKSKNEVIHGDGKDGFIIEGYGGLEGIGSKRIGSLWGLIVELFLNLMSQSREYFGEHLSSLDDRTSCIK